MSDISPEVTPEIWLEILKCLPVKTLGQCRCVCKSWNVLIISPSFMAVHLKFYTLNEANSLLLYRQFSKAPQRREQYTLFLDSAEGKGEKNLKASHTFTCPFMAHKSRHQFRVVGSVHGLICLSDDLFSYTYLVLLWNPLLHKYIRLPVPSVTYHTTGAYIAMFGFGYDSRKGDHKVVRLVYVRDKVGLDETPPLVELYSVKEGKWRRGSAANLVNYCICDFWWSQCFLNGAIHWVAWESDAKERVFQRNWLLLFDVEQEKFKKMRLPEALGKVNTICLSVTEYGGKLSVLHSVLKGGLVGKEMQCCEIWVKGEYSVGNSWSRVVSIDLDSNVHLGWVQCLRKNEEVLAFTKGGELVSYDPNTKQTKRLGLRGRWRS